MAVVYNNHTGAIRSLSAATEVESDPLLCRTFCIPAFSAVYVSGMDSWRADFLSQQHLDQGEWSLQSELFQDLCHGFGMPPDVDLLTFRFNNKKEGFYSVVGILWQQQWMLWWDHGINTP